MKKQSKRIREKEASLKKTVKQMQDDFKETRKALEPIVKAYGLWLTKYLGKRCKHYATGCVVCHAWQGYDIIKGLL